MPRYFFNQMDGHVEGDEDGSDLPNFAAAREEAIIFLGETIRDRPSMLNNTGEFRVEVTNEAGSILTTVIVHAIDTLEAEVSLVAG